MFMFALLGFVDVAASCRQHDVLAPPAASAAAAERHALRRATR
jgi:hypothetical protein